MSLHGCDYLPDEPRLGVHYQLLSMDQVAEAHQLGVGDGTVERFGVGRGPARNSWASLRRSHAGPRHIARGADRPVCLGRPSGRLASHRWVGQGFQQRPDLGIGVASMTTQGTEIGQATLLGPATHRLGRHMKELGDLRCTEVCRLGWLWHRTLHSWRVSPMWWTTLSPSGATAIQRSTQRASRRLTTWERLEHDARSMSDAVVARLEVHHRAAVAPIGQPHINHGSQVAGAGSGRA